MLHLVEQAGLSDRFAIDSAGTGGYHIGEPADHRSLQAARKRGVDLPSRARKFERADFARFDYVLAMDDANLDALKRLGGGKNVHLLRDFDPQSSKGSSVPDPYYGGSQGFEVVLDQCFAACEGLLQHLTRENPP